jgi:intein/homing endonuclease
MTPTKQELLDEIIELKRKLEISARWMKRQVTESIKQVTAERIKKQSRYRFQNNLERDQLVLIEQSIEMYF